MHFDSRSAYGEEAEDNAICEMPAQKTPSDDTEKGAPIGSALRGYWAMRRTPYSSMRSNSSLPTPQMGHVKSSGSSSTYSMWPQMVHLQANLGASDESA